MVSSRWVPGLSTGRRPVSAPVEGQGSGDEGDEETGGERRGEQDAWRGVEDPGSLRRDDAFLVQELREIAVRLEDPRPAPSLHARFEQTDETDEPRRNGQ